MQRQQRAGYKTPASLDAELSQLKDISAKESQIKDTKAELEEAKAVERTVCFYEAAYQYMYENGNMALQTAS
ncbi:MAG: hypothetical protein ACLVB3_09510 [Clostridium sp.]